MAKSHRCHLCKRHLYCNNKLMFFLQMFYFLANKSVFFKNMLCDSLKLITFSSIYTYRTISSFHCFSIKENRKMKRNPLIEPNKISFKGIITSIEPRATVWRYRMSNRTHREIGYNIFVK